MAVLTVRNLPDEVHRALRVQAADHGRSTEAEVRAILQAAVKPKEDVGFGTLLWNIARESGVTNEDVAALERELARNRTPAKPMSFE